MRAGPCLAALAQVAVVAGYRPPAVGGHQCALRVGSPILCTERDSERGTYEATSSPVRTLVSTLTGLVNGISDAVSGGERETAAPPAPRDGMLTASKLLAGVRADYEERLYLWTGDIDPDLYDEGCAFTDPTLSFVGLATFQRNLAALRPLLDRLVREPVIDLYSCDLDEPVNQVRARWRMAADLNLPWGPAIDLRGQTTFTYDPQRGGRIVEYVEAWEIGAGAALMQLVTPTQKRRDGDTGQRRL